MKETIEGRIRKRIFSKGAGWVFTPAYFLDLGERSSVDKALASLTEQKIIRRLTRGIYDYPAVHEILGELSPELDKLAEVLKTKNVAKLQPSDAYAAYLLGLTEQIPMKIVFLTDGSSRQVKIKGHHFTLKHTTPKNLATAGRMSGTVLQALRWLGKDHVDEKMIDLLKARLTDADKKILLHDLGLVPAWVANAFREIAKTSTKESGFEKFIVLEDKEKRLYLNEASSRCGLPAAALEKDLWVCWLLDVLFHLPELGQHLTFKGGTSLSKGWKLIKRFSEDIDLTVDKEPLGFGGDHSPEKAPSKKQMKKRLEGLKAACQKFVGDQLRPLLEVSIQKRLGGNDVRNWKLTIDLADPDNQTLLFSYPSVFPVSSNSYLRADVKIELGARSDNWPAIQTPIVPYMAEVLPNFGDWAVSARILRPERTFWEKATLLHEENQRPDGKSRKARMARHLYDIWALIKAGVATEAAKDMELFKRVVEHRQFFFSYGWTDNQSMARGTLKIAPTGESTKDWKQDYEKMKGEMFFEDPPAFGEIIKVIKAFETDFNGKELD